jgi:hypothetical protein
MNLDNFLNIFRRKPEPQMALPFWAFRLECPVCKMSFISPEAHYKQALKDLNYKHQRCRQ